jgi:hypothetical protein
MRPRVRGRIAPGVLNERPVSGGFCAAALLIGGLNKLNPAALGVPPMRRGNARARNTAPEHQQCICAAQHIAAGNLREKYSQFIR